MPHIHTKPGQHDHTVSIYIFRIDFDEPKVLLHVHKKIKKTYAQFGGHIELDENPWQSAAHELEEETGYNLRQVQILQPSSRVHRIAGAVVHPYPVVHSTMSYPDNKTHFHTDTTYAFITSEAPANKPGEGESTDLKLFSREEVVSSANIDGITRDTALYIFDTCLKDWQPVSTKSFE